MKSDLVADDVRRAGTLGGLFDIEINVCAFFEVRTANVFHVEEHVIVRIVRRNETVAACVVEEINRTVCHYTNSKYDYTFKHSAFVFKSRQQRLQNPKISCECGYLTTIWQGLGQ